MPTPTADIINDADRPRLAPYVRLTFDPARERHVLLAPEAVSVLNGTGGTILELCDGRRTVAAIVAELSERYAGVDGAEVRRFLARLVARRTVVVEVVMGPGPDVGLDRGPDPGPDRGPDDGAAHG
jgi:pyrroloquinoline quinone biosynthesis protein D